MPKFPCSIKNFIYFLFCQKFDHYLLIIGQNMKVIIALVIPNLTVNIFPKNAHYF